MDLISHNLRLLNANVLSINVPGGVTGKATGAAKLSGTHRHTPGTETGGLAAAAYRWLLEPATECYGINLRGASTDDKGGR